METALRVNWFGAGFKNRMGYCFGFNGQLKDDEVYGDANAYDFGARLYDPRLGKWLAVDPLAAKYPFTSPYAFAKNAPILLIDIDGKKWINPYQSALAAAKLENPNSDEVKLLSHLATEVDNIIATLRNNDPELYDYIESLQSGGYQVNVFVYLSNSEYSPPNPAIPGDNGGAEANTNFSWNTAQMGNEPPVTYVNSADISYADIAGNVKPRQIPNSFNVVLYKTADSPQDEKLANEAGDVMFAIENSEVSQSEDNSLPYMRKYSTHYSFNVETVYKARKEGVEPVGSCVYPLINDDKSSRTQDGRSVNHAEKPPIK